MSDSDDELRKAPENWRGYLKESLEIVRVFGWVFRELVTPEARREAKLGVACRLLGMLVMAVGPLCYAAAIDAGAARDRTAALAGIAGFVAVIAASKWLMSLGDRKTERVAGLTIASIESGTTRLFLSKSLGQHFREDSKLTPGNIEKGVNHSIGGVLTIMNHVVPAGAELLVGFVFLFVFSPIAGLCLTAALLGYLVFHVWMNRRIIEECGPIDADLRAANRFRFERLENPERVKTSGKEDADVEKLRTMLADGYERDFAFWHRFLVLCFRRGLFGTMMWGLAVAWGFHLASTGAWQIGTAAALVYWANMVRENLYRIGGIEFQLNKEAYRVSPMMEALTMPAEIEDKPGAVALEDGPVTVEVEGASFLYPPRAGSGETGSAVIEDIRFTVAPGEKVALIGESGAGKSTLMRLLMRYSDPASGAVKVNGIPLTGIKLRSWQALIGYIPQQAQVFNGTIGENIRYAMTEAQNARVGDAALEALMKQVGLDGPRFEKGLATMVGRRGIKLSGGEAQRLMVLAAIARSPRFLIVDEATSSLDSTTEKKVQAAIEQAVEASSSALIIAHRLSTVRRCTKFVVLRPHGETKDGRPQVEAVARSFEELHRVSPTFRRLAADQGLAVGETQAIGCSVRPEAFYPPSARK